MSLMKSYGLRQVARLRCRAMRREQTPAEAALWSVLRNRSFLGLKFNRQHPIFHDLEGVETFYIADFYCHALRLVIELDGSVHNLQTGSDVQRDDNLRALGLTVLRFENRMVFENIDTILAAIKALTTE
jgi:very-short-patch-repair endonuclease